MDKNKLQEYVSQGFSARQIAKALECSPTNVRYWLKKYDLATFPVRVHHCGSCGQRDPEKFYGRKKYMCGECHNRYTLERGQKLKQQARDWLGARCVHCGYDTFQVALDIHHLDPTLKDPNFASMRSWSWQRLEAELKSCILLCRNCHAALHSGLIKVY